MRYLNLQASLERYPGQNFRYILLRHPTQMTLITRRSSMIERTAR